MDGVSLPTWETIALSKGFRGAPLATQNQIRFLWLTSVAPVLYPNYGKDPETTTKLRNYIYNTQTPPVIPDEEQIITPDTLNLNSFIKIEQNDLFKKKSYKNQQYLKQLWYLKTANTDPEFKKLTENERKDVYTKLMTRYPMMSSKLIPQLDPTTAREDVLTKSVALQKAAKFTNNFNTAFEKMALAIPLGGLKLLTQISKKWRGEDNPITQIMYDIEKRQDWFNETIKMHKFWGEVLPSLTGGLMGFSTGYKYTGLKAFENAIAGRVGQSMEYIPGIIEKTIKGAGIAKATPTIAFQTVGGAIAGATHGIAQAIAENKDWKTYLPRDLTLGVGMEFLGRYISLATQFKKALKDLGVSDLSFLDIVRGPMGFGTGKLPASMKHIISQNPHLKYLLTSMQNIDKDGILLPLLYSKQGLKMKADIDGLKMEEIPNGFRFKKGNKVLYEAIGPENAAILKADNFLSAYTDYSRKVMSTKTKGFAEALANADKLAIRGGVRVPVSGRKLFGKFLEDHPALLAESPVSPNPRTEGEFYDKMTNIFRRWKRPATISKKLANAGITIPFEKADIKYLKDKLDQLEAGGAYILVDKKTGQTINEADLPLRYFDAPDVKDPEKVEHVFYGDPQTIRQVLTRYRKQYIAQATQATRFKNQKLKQGIKVNIKHYKDTQVIDVGFGVKTKDGKYTADAWISFPSMKDAARALSEGRIKGANGITSTVFKSDPSLELKYALFLKDYRKAHGSKISSDFLPATFTSISAAQKGYQLGVYKGKYILQDVSLDGTTNIKTYVFDDLVGVNKFLENNDPRPNYSNLTGDITADTVADITGKPVDPVYPNFEKLRSEKAKQYNMLTYMRTQFSPPQWSVKSLEKLEATKFLRENYGWDPTTQFNKLRTMDRAMSANYVQWSSRLKKISKGFNEQDANYIQRWVEAVETDNIAEDLLRKVGSPIETKAKVETEYLEKYGQAKLNKLLKGGAELERYYRELYSLANEDWKLWVRYYQPRLRLEAAKASVGYRLDLRRMDWLPDATKKEFFEFAREVDPVTYLREPNAFHVANIYTRLMSRKLFMRPVLDEIKTNLKDVLNRALEEGKAPKDLDKINEFFRTMISDYLGKQDDNVIKLRAATTNTIQSLFDKVNKRWGTKFGVKRIIDPISGFTTLTTASQLAFRPWLTFRNLTQSLLTGGTTIGINWWGAGIEELMRPGTIGRLIDIGIIDPRSLPIGGGYQIRNYGLGALVKMGMKPYMVADYVNRAVVYFGMSRRIENAFKLLESKKITMKKFSQLSGMTLFGKGEYNYFASLWNRGKGFEAFKDAIASKAVDRTQYLYNLFDQPQAFRGIVGRMFGQYGVWPLSFMNLIGERLGSDTMTIAQKVGFLARMTAVTGAVTYGLASVGLDPKQFYPWNMLLFSGGPYYSMTNDLIQAASGDRDALRAATTGLKMLIPFSSEGSAVAKALQALNDGDPYEAFLQFVGAPIRLDVFPKRTTGLQITQKELSNWVLNLSQKMETDYLLP